MLQIILLPLIFFASSDSQFAYPVDENPPQFNVTFSCYDCEGINCETEEPSETVTCSGPRTACWTVKNLDSLVYTRTCRQPSSIRQGVFCNRHMVNKEFCYSYQTSTGRQRVCAKCCLDNFCNVGELQGHPDQSLQSCFACLGDREERCNQILSPNLENSTYVEQCLLPNSDCWTERRRNGGNSFYVRGCQLRVCNDDNKKEICSISNGEEICESCCQGKLCNGLSSGPTLSSSCGWKKFLFFIIISSFMIVKI